ncbi:MAG: DUF502 domain-containing protein [Candidatus Brocadiia bacterium]|nr:MAG: DUF502 domain-containing protein [Candidatus Brocadiia bacterium]
MNKLLNYFLKGLLVFVPAALTVFAVVWAFTQLDTMFGDLFRIKIPGLGLVATIVLITVIGFMATNFLGRKVFALIDRLFTKLPLVKLLYSSVKDMVGAFAGDRKSFDKPVIVELMPDGPKVMGFITRESLEFLGLADHVSVYLPQSYNFAGSILIFPADKVKPLKIESSEAMAFIVSGGVSGK